MFRGFPGGWRFDTEASSLHPHPLSKMSDPAAGRGRHPDMSRMQDKTCSPQQGEILPSEQVPADRHQEERIQGGGATGGEKVFSFKKNQTVCVCVVRVCVRVCVLVCVCVRMQHIPGMPKLWSLSHAGKCVCVVCVCVCGVYACEVRVWCVCMCMCVFVNVCVVCVHVVCVCVCVCVYEEIEERGWPGGEEERNFQAQQGSSGSRCVPCPL